MKVKPLGFWQRFVAVFTSDFLERLEQDKDSGKSWGFWFLSNFFLVALPFIGLVIAATVLLSSFPQNAIEKIPEDISFEMPDGTEHNIKNLIGNFSFTINENFELETENVPDPLIFYVVETEEEGGNAVFVNEISEIDSDAELVFVLDTKDKTTDIETIGQFKNAFYILHDKFVTTDQGDHNVEIIRYADSIGGDSDAVFPLTINLAKITDSTPIIGTIVFAMLGIFFVLAYIFFAVFRLISALFWALVFWGVGVVAKVKDWDFEKSLSAMLHFSFVTMLVCPAFMILGLSSFSSALVILIVLFGMNFYHMKKA